MKAIETEHLTKFYGKARGITDVNLSVEEGDFLDLSVPTEPENPPPYALFWD